MSAKLNLAYLTQLRLSQSVDPQDRQALIRFEHLFEEYETYDELDKPVTFTLTEDFFTTITITNIQEMSLGGNMWKSEMNRLKWGKNESVSRAYYYTIITYFTYRYKNVKPRN